MHLTKNLPSFWPLRKANGQGIFEVVEGVK